MQYLIKFTYDHYCQGWEDADAMLLVTADTFEQACDRIRALNHKYDTARDFENLTIE